MFDGDYKLREVVEYGTYELYNLANDPLDQQDISRKYPKILQSMIDKLRKWEKDVGAPKLTFNPDYTLN